MERIPEAELVAVMVLGYVLQWARAAQKIPHWQSWAGVVIAALALWWWMTPDAGQAVATDWRRASVAVVTFALSAQGAARAIKDGKGAPPTNSL